MHAPGPIEQRLFRSGYEAHIWTMSIAVEIVLLLDQNLANLMLFHERTELRSNRLRSRL